MSTLNSHHLPHPNGLNGDGHPAALDNAPQGEPIEPSALEVWDEDEGLRQEMERLTAEHQELLTGGGLASPADGAAPEEDDHATRELAQLRAENARLRVKVEDLEQQLLASAQDREQAWAEQQRDYEVLLEEKSEVIRNLHLKVQELRQSADAAEPTAPEAAGGGVDLRQELQRLREQLETERRQLQEDEEAVEQQMKQMELSMSRERVELARQRAELQRLHNDFKHELDLAARDATLRERLLPLQRRHQEVINSKGAAPPPRPASSAQLHAPQKPPPMPAAKRPSSGLLGRLFGGKDA